MKSKRDKKKEVCKRAKCANFLIFHCYIFFLHYLFASQSLNVIGVCFMLGEYFSFYFKLPIVPQTKDSTESRFRSGGNTSNRGSRSGTDRYGGRGGSTQFSSSGM